MWSWRASRAVYETFDPPINAASRDHGRGRKPSRAPQNPAPSCVSPPLQLKHEWSPWPESGSDRGSVKPKWGMAIGIG
jgi:hypothetical protein